MGSTGNAPRTSPLYPRRSSMRDSGGLVEERAVSHRRQDLQGRIDLIRGELVRRGSVALSPEELVRVLMRKGERA
jgi:hypothetical protein